MINVSPVILCGGSGTRLWPLSRTGFPKQFLCIAGTTSLFQDAVGRLSHLGCAEVQVQPPLVVTSDDHRFLVTEQLREVGIELGCALLEPVARNTAPALTVAALTAIESDNDTILVAVPADQSILDQNAFRTSILHAIREADRGHIVVLGVTPHAPETGYGYIHVGQREVNGAALTVRGFVEKPDVDTARSYLVESSYFWNAGVFVVRASVWLKALARFRPDIHQATISAWEGRGVDGKFVRFPREEFASIPSASVDYAVIERCPGSPFSIKAVPLDAGWSDLGSWDAVWDALPKDNHGNAVVGDVLATGTSNTIAYATSRLVSLIGVREMVVVETPDAVLVADRSHSQQVKQIVAILEQQQRDEQRLHRKVHRPWGWYDSIEVGDRFKVKRIQVNPQASLSLQKHHHRAEHWIVVKGTAEITNGDKVFLLTENQSTYIPLGEVHRLANPGTIPLEIIEVQSGSYLEEDDIVRFEDHYGRNDK